MSEAGAARPRTASASAAGWAPPHNPVALTGPDPYTTAGGSTAHALTPFVVRLEELDPELAARLQREVGMVGGNATLEPAGAAGHGVALRVALAPGHLEALRTRLLTTSTALSKLAEEIALAMRSWEQVQFRWRCGSREVVCAERPLIMGILNCTPDSFWRGSQASGSEAVDRAVRMVEEGADLLDVGGESTRPGSAEIDADEEISRVVPVIEAVRARLDVPISIDTTKAAVARAAIAAGADAINDISGLAYDPEIAAVAAETGAGLVLMHMRGRPADMYGEAKYDDVAIEVVRELRRSIGAARAAGVAREALVADPGIGFAKRPEHSLAVLRRLPLLRALGVPLLVGPSRKSFLAAVVDLPPEERLEGTAAAVAASVLAGAHILRVHDPEPMRRVALTAAAIRSEGAAWTS